MKSRVVCIVLPPDDLPGKGKSRSIIAFGIFGKLGGFGPLYF
jgi:hypothetical protein